MAERTVPCGAGFLWVAGLPDRRGAAGATGSSSLEGSMVIVADHSCDSPLAIRVPMPAENFVRR
jgi:hypothetical protein